MSSTEKSKQYDNVFRTDILYNFLLSYMNQSNMQRFQIEMSFEYYHRHHLLLAFEVEYKHLPNTNQYLFSIQNSDGIYKSFQISEPNSLSPRRTKSNCFNSPSEYLKVLLKRNLLRILADYERDLMRKRKLNKSVTSNQKQIDVNYADNSLNRFVKNNMKPTNEIVLNNTSTISEQQRATVPTTDNVKELIDLTSDDENDDANNSTVPTEPIFMINAKLISAIMYIDPFTKKEIIKPVKLHKHNGECTLRPKVMIPIQSPLFRASIPSTETSSTTNTQSLLHNKRLKLVDKIAPSTPKSYESITSPTATVDDRRALQNNRLKVPLKKRAYHSSESLPTPNGTSVESNVNNSVVDANQKTNNKRDAQAEPAQHSSTEMNEKNECSSKRLVMIIRNNKIINNSDINNCTTKSVANYGDTNDVDFVSSSTPKGVTASSTLKDVNISSTKNNVGQLKCSVCNMTFQRQYNLKRHQISIHKIKFSK